MRSSLGVAGVVSTAVALASCADPPRAELADAAARGAIDASVLPQLPDATTAADATPSGADARTVDAAPPVPDAVQACTPFEPERDAGAGGADNPYGIRLTDVTYELPAQYPSGRPERDAYLFGYGAALIDVDSDGDLDVILARNDKPDLLVSGGPSVLLRNQGSAAPLAAFVEDTAFAALTAGRAVHGIGAGDFDADGDVDLFLACEGPDLLLRNEGGGSFQDVTVEAGVAGLANDMTSSGIFADLNNDGLLDLYVTSHVMSVPPSGNPANANRLFLNRGDGSFEDVTVLADVGGDGSTHSALISDLDGDGLLEIFVANDRFSVDGGPGFTALEVDALYDSYRVDEQARPYYVNSSSVYGLNTPHSAMGSALADIDGDGNDDLYVSDYGVNDLFLWYPPGPSYLSDFNFYDLRVGANSGTDHLISWGARFMDLDRDGLLELFVVNGSVLDPPASCEDYAQMDVYLRRGAVNGAFSDISLAVGLPDLACPTDATTPLNGRGVVVGDLDGDGDDDLVVTPYNEVPHFYRNDTPQCGRSAVRVRLRGTVSSPDPIGARLTVVRSDGRTIRRTRYAGGDLYSQSDSALEVGLDSGLAVDSATVAWPSGLEQDITGQIVLDQLAEISEPEWLSVTPRVAMAGDSAELTYRPVDSAGQPLGVAGAGRSVVITRSDGVDASVLDLGNGTYVAQLPHPGAARVTSIQIEVDGVVQRARPTVHYK